MSLLKDSSRILGVMQNESSGSPPFTEASFCKKLCMAGQKHGVLVLIFCPLWVNRKTKTVRSYTYRLKQGWKEMITPIPQLVFDRLSFVNKDHFRKVQGAVSYLKRIQTKWLGIGLSGKWDVYRMLKGEELLKKIMPETVLYQGSQQLADFINRHHGSVFLKPHGGSKGRSVLHVTRVYKAAHGSLPSESSTIMVIEGRDWHNEPFVREFQQPKDCLAWIGRFIGNRKFVMQPFLTLHTRDDKPYDVRVLMQKNESGRWTMTGMAARIGQPGAVTSNLHGGGHAVSLAPFLAEQFSTEESERLIQELEAYSTIIPTAIEQQHGRLVECGIDFGIDQHARIWLLEVNSKPGRTVFTQTGDHEAAKQAVEKPILYAKSIMVRHLRRVCP